MLKTLLYIDIFYNVLNEFNITRIDILILNNNSKILTELLNIISKSSKFNIIVDILLFQIYAMKTSLNIPVEKLYTQKITN